MAESGTATILKRKTAQAREATAAPKGPPTPGRALAEAFRRAAEVELELSVTAPPPRERRATGAEIVELLPEHAFLAVLTGPEDGAGLMVLDPAALSAVIEMRTIGRVSARAPVPRRPTQTDAAMAADLIDRVLSEFESPLLASDDARWSAGWRYQLYLPESRPLSVVLDEGSYRVFDVAVMFGAAGKEGRAILALPLPGRGRPVRLEPPPPESAAAEAAEAWQAALGESVESAEAVLDAQLGRVRLSLGALASLKPGDRLALPLSALGGVRLVAPGGTAVAEARLGQTGGLRAVKIRGTEPRAVAALAEGAVLGPARDPATDPSAAWTGDFTAARPGAAAPHEMHPEAPHGHEAERLAPDIESALNEPLPGLELLTGARRPSTAAPTDRT